MIPILFVRDDSEYKQMPGVDCYDKQRDARNYDGALPVVAHPPCRAWGVLSHMANPAPGEYELAIEAVRIIRKNGGVLEHPAGSKLWKTIPLPEPGMFPDEFGGWSLLIDQYDWGHVASKPTKLYIVGVKPQHLPEMPPRRWGTPAKSITGQVPGTARCTQYEREYTPELLRLWLVEVARRCNVEAL